jgi:hypothetical protein
MMAPHYLQAILIKMATDEAVDRFLTTRPNRSKRSKSLGNKSWSLRALNASL